MLTLRPLLRAVLLGAVLSLGSLVAAETKKTYAIPASDAATALKQFSAISGRETLFAAEIVRGVKTPPVKGELTVQEALDALLSGTGLLATIDAKSGAIAVRRELSIAEKNGASRPAEAPAAKTRIEDGVVQLEQVQVTGTRIRSLLGEATPTPAIVYTSADFESMGVQSLSDLARYIPQLTVEGETAEITANGLSNNSGFVGQGGRVSFGDIRGLAKTNTLVLVDGRRLPKTGQSTGYDAYDLNGIPLSAVERIEILPAGDSAVYGADAVSGVINFIMKKSQDYTVLGYTYRNAWDTDVAQQTVSLNTGFKRGHFSSRLTLEYKKNNGMARRDRWWTASYDRRPLGGSDNRGTIPDGSGTVSTLDGSNLPGLNSPTATIPVNSDGRNVTIADYAAAGTPPPVLDAAKYTRYATSDAQRVRYSMEYELRPWLILTGEAGRGNKDTLRPGDYQIPVLGPGKSGSGTIAPTTTLSAQQASSSRVVVPAGYPGNPFGVPLLVKKAFWDAISELEQHEINRNEYLEIGVRGNLPHEWQYQSYTRYSSDYYKMTNDMRFSLPALNAAINNPDPSQRPILLHNSQRFRPNSPASIRALFNARPSVDEPVEWEYAAQADGPLWSLVSGPIRTALAANVRETYTDFTFVPGDGGAFLQGAYNRRVTELSTEVRVPIFGAQRRWRGIYQFDVHAAMRTTSDTYYHRSEQVPTYGFLYQPTAWITLRASHSENYTLPRLSDVAGRVDTLPMWLISLGQDVLDPKRGNKVIDYDFPVLSGSNRDLKAERGRTDSISVDMSVPGIKGLQLSLNYTDIKTSDGIAAGDYDTILRHFPERVSRAPRTPADIAAGWDGEITALDVRNINMARSRLRNLDVRLHYRYSFNQRHRLLASVDQSIPLEYSEQVRPDSPLVDRTNEMSMRSVFRLNWEKDPYSLGVAWIYTAKADAGIYLPSEPPIRASSQFDFSASYDFGAEFAAQGWRRHLLRNLKLSARVINAFPEEPRFRVSSGTLLGRESALFRQFQIDLRKSF